MIELYTTDSCGYCVQAKRLLKHQGIDFVEYPVNGLEGRDNYREMRERIGMDKQATVPQIFVGDYHIGGFTELRNLKREKKLESTIQEFMSNM